jgi:hypothetical protein
LQENQKKVVLNRNYKDYDDLVKKNYALDNIKASETLANYGSIAKNLQYISSTDQNQFHITDEAAMSYNMMIPHYQFAYALFNTNLKTFIEDWRIGLELSHDYEHDLFRSILNDPSFSVTTFLFWPYHSWIDAQIEIKLRMGNA